MKSKNLAIASVMTALGVIILYFSSVTPVGNVGLIALAGLAPAAAYSYSGRLYGWLCYFAVAIVSFLICPVKTCVILFLACFGLYPVIRHSIEKIPHIPLRWAVKLIFANAVFTAGFFSYKYLFAAELENIKLGVFSLFALGNAVFIIYDIGLSRLAGSIRRLNFIKK